MGVACFDASADAGCLVDAATTTAVDYIRRGEHLNRQERNNPRPCLLPYLNDMVAFAKANVEHSSSFVEPSPSCPEASEQRPLPSYTPRAVQDHVMLPANFQATFTRCSRRLVLTERWTSHSPDRDPHARACVRVIRPGNYFTGFRTYIHTDGTYPTSSSRPGLPGATILHNQPTINQSTQDKNTECIHPLGAPNGRTTA